MAKVAGSRESYLYTTSSSMPWWRMLTIAVISVVSIGLWLGHRSCNWLGECFRGSAREWRMVVRIINILGKSFGVKWFPNMFESDTFIKSTYSSFVCLWMISTIMVTGMRNRRGWRKFWSGCNFFTEIFLKMTSFSFHTSPCTRGNHICYSRGGVQAGRLWNE